MPQGTVGVSPAQFLGVRTIPGQWLREARPKLQSFTESVVGLRLVGRPPGAQTGINPSSCLGEEDCSWPATRSQFSQKHFGLWMAAQLLLLRGMILPSY